MTDTELLITKETRALSRLEMLDAKTGNSYMKRGRVCRMRTGGGRRILGGEHGSQYYHVMSRTTGGDFLMKSEEKEAFRKIMRRMGKFSGVQVLTWVVLDNHFHILARVPEKKTYLEQFDDREGEPLGAGEERLMKHLTSLYTHAYISRVREELADLRTRGMDDQAEQFLENYKRRFCDISLYIKEVKERFSRWYNKKHSRKGTLWMSRFKSVLVENGDALRAISAYIDLNPVRAGLVEDPKDYRWCGYAEAVAGVREGRRGLCRVMGKSVDSWHKHGSWYRCWLMIDGKEVEEDKIHHVKARTGIPKEKVEAELKKGGRLSLGHKLRSRVSHFTEGAAIGSRSFVETSFEQNREKFGPCRKIGAKPMGVIELLKMDCKVDRSEVDHPPNAQNAENEKLKYREEKFYTLQGAIRRFQK